ncbi:MAG: insulinase family protein [Oscillospiraceae bacterium]|nr:insulinase family protein [Oscillospiraceae bacterium]
MTRQLLTDNVFLTCVPAEKHKTGFFSAQMTVPLSRETASLNALLVNVLSRGTARCPNLQALGRELDLLYGARIGASVRRSGENQIFGFGASCIDDRYVPTGESLLEPMARLMGEILCDPSLVDGRLNPLFVNNERENLVDVIRSIINDKRAYAAQRLREEMFRDEPYGVSRAGSVETAEAITTEMLDGHYRSILPQARLELFYCGSAPEEKMFDAFRKALAGLPRGGRLEPAVTTRRPAPEKYRLVTEEMDVTQGKLCIGFRSSSEDVPASIMMNTMYGGGSNSKLFLNVREKLSLCYYAGSSYDRRKGVVLVSSGIAPKNYDPAVEEIMAQLDALRRGEWEDWEFTGAKSALRNDLRTIDDSPTAQEDFIISQAAAGSTETPQEMAAAIEAVTPERVIAAAQAVRPDTIYFLKGKEA